MAHRAPAPWKVIAGLTVAGALVFLTGVGVVVATGSRYVRPAAALSFAEAESAYASCEQFARNDRPAPGAVTFAPIQQWHVRRYVDGRVRVRTRATATSGTGRRIELRVSCRLSPAGGGRWSLEHLSVSSD